MSDSFFPLILIVLIPAALIFIQYAINSSDKRKIKKYFKLQNRPVIQIRSSSAYSFKNKELLARLRKPTVKSVAFRFAFMEIFDRSLTFYKITFADGETGQIVLSEVMPFAEYRIYEDE